jgi:tetrahydrodipicolinate N-succinyltransferase
MRRLSSGNGLPGVDIGKDVLVGVRVTVGEGISVGRLVAVDEIGVKIGVSAGSGEAGGTVPQAARKTRKTIQR